LIGFSASYKPVAHSVLTLMFQSRGFFLSLLFGNLLLIGIILGTRLLAISYEISQRTTHLTEQFQAQLLDVVLRDFQESWPNIDKERIEQYFQHRYGEPKIRLTVIDSEGRVLGDSEFPAEKMEPHHDLERPEIIAALDGKIGRDTRLSKTTNIEYRYLAMPLFKKSESLDHMDDQHEPVAVVRVAFPVEMFRETGQAVFGNILKGLAAILFTAMILSLLLRYLWYRPLRILTDEARRIAEGNLEPSLPVESPLEMAQLSQSLETMRRTVSRQLETITQQRESLQTILRHLPDAIFAMNRGAKVIYYNAAAKKLFRIESTPERPYLQEIVRNAAIVEWYLECRKTSGEFAYSSAGTPIPSRTERKEIDLFGRRHFLELEFVETENAAKEDAACLLIVSDLTENVRANKMKTDFVANASHELRTPLAAIRAALDNFSEEVYEDRVTLEKIIQVVDRHVSRLDALIEDLLALNSTEDETISGRLEQTNVADQRSWIEELFRKRIDEKRLLFSVVSDFEDVSFRVDNKRLGLILQNLMDNAVKFTPEGGRISLIFRREGANLVIECRDTGLGIAAEEQQRVFERFYQVDSAKTGDGRLRGTGLGLAIVKHAVERLRGSVTLESRIAQGSVFTVRIPVEFI